VWSRGKAEDNFKGLPIATIVIKRGALWDLKQESY